jgi:hypothetical protein
MEIVCVPLEELLCQTVMGQISAHVGASGYALSCLAFKWPCHLRTPAFGSLARYYRPPGVATEFPDAC